MTSTVVVPSHLVWRGDDPVAVFVEVDTTHLRLPFWLQTLERASRVVGMQALDAIDAGADATLDGLIHHTSRCGSTLVVRQLSAISGVLALSEPPIFEHLLDRETGDPSLRARRLRVLVSLHRDALRSVCDRLVVKASVMVALHAGEIEDALANVPTVFLHRDATEVLRSLERELPGALDNVRPSHLVGVQRAAWPVGAAPPPPLALATLVIASACDSMLDTRAVRSTDHAGLPAATVDRIAPFFGIDPTHDDRAAMLGLAAFEAKDASSTAPFRSRERDDLSPDARRLADEVLGPALARATGHLAPL